MRTADSATGLDGSSSGKPARGSRDLALTGLLSKDGVLFWTASRVRAEAAATFANPLAPKSPHFTPKAKSVIFLFMYGGPSHVDTFDYKPKLYGLDGQTIPIKTFGRGGKKNEGRVVGPKWKFHQYGTVWEVGQRPLSASRQERGRHRLHSLDDCGFANSRLGNAPDEHGQDPFREVLCMGSWVNYGLGSVNEDLPPVSWSCSTRRAARFPGRRTGRVATCRRVTRARFSDRPG